MKKKHEVKTLKEISREYISPTPARQVDRRILKFVAGYVIERLKEGSVLEMGVGDRVWTPLVLKRFGETSVVDASSELLESLKEFAGLGRIEKYCSLFEDFSPDVSFDNILCTYVLEHVDDPVEILRRAADWLNPDGGIHLVIPHALSLHRRLAVLMNLQKSPGDLGDSDRHIGHRRCLTHTELDSLVGEAGLKIVERTGLISKLVPNLLMEKFPDEILDGIVRLGAELPIEYSGTLYYCITKQDSAGIAGDR